MSFLAILGGFAGAVVAVVVLTVAVWSCTLRPVTYTVIKRAEILEEEEAKPPGSGDPESLVAGRCGSDERRLQRLARVLRQRGGEVSQHKALAEHCGGAAWRSSSSAMYDLASNLGWRRLQLARRQRRGGP
ncbi:hypothetical protein T484DRAFT_1794583 [Baffinella frigidus]|nr:hypothetical protein T484DRAFT_1794583 [Cryptophyta sp. CCMP2293]